MLLVQFTQVCCMLKKDLAEEVGILSAWCFTSLQTPGEDVYEMDSTPAGEYSVCHQFTMLAERKKCVS